MDKIYVDTNIFLDALKDRKSRNGRDLGTPAKSLFSRAKHGQFDIIVSDWTLEELSQHVEESRVKKLLSKLEDAMVRCGYTGDQKQKAKQRSDHWQDYLHGLIAKEQDADCIVTRNVKDLRTLSGLKVKLPSHV